MMPTRFTQHLILAEPNMAIRELLVKPNDRKFRRLDSTRTMLFEELERPALRELRRFFPFATMRRPEGWPLGPRSRLGDAEALGLDPDVFAPANEVVVSTLEDDSDPKLAVGEIGERYQKYV